MNIKKIMIFGRPGSGKSTFASVLRDHLGLPLHHLDKYFYEANWVERNYQEFLQIQRSILENDRWIVDGNSVRSLEMRYSKADLVLYFNYPRRICYWRIVKRLWQPNQGIDDRAPGCKETIRFSLLRYIWGFEKRVESQILSLKNKYPTAVFREIKNNKDLKELGRQLVGTA
jgi:adenylate kinase family enzyme